jgi:uracil DNA glycosylase
LTLQDHMRIELAGWAGAIPNAWRGLFDGVSPNFDASSLMQTQDEEFRPSYPPLREREGGPWLFRPFRNILPAQVRVVALGQDPYPERARATGRAFEDSAAHRLGIAPSLRRLLQSALTAMNQNLRADQDIHGWNIIQGQVGARLSDQAAMTHYFDGLAAQGVLLMNAAWTFTEIAPPLDPRERARRLGRVQRAHRALWRPVTRRVIRQLAEQDQPPVFLLFGREAQACFNFATQHLQAIPTNIFCDHPTARRGTYFDVENPLRQVNQALEVPGDIQWWPPIVPVPIP